MDITPLIAADRQVIQSYSAAGFKISGRAYDGAVIVFPDRTLDWPAADIASADFSQVRAEEVDVLLLGCGPRMVLPPPALRAAMKARGITLEAMDTGAACRTYNVLLADGRRVAAALLPAA